MHDYEAFLSGADKKLGSQKEAVAAENPEMLSATFTQFKVPLVITIYIVMSPFGKKNVEFRNSSKI